jgi:hypothetical protein
VAGLGWCRDGTTCDALARDHGISRATACRYLDEVIAVLAGQAPGLRQALERARDGGFSQVVLDGKIIPCDRCKEPALRAQGEVSNLWHSGKAHAQGRNVQAVTAPAGSRCGSPGPSPARCTTSPPLPPRLPALYHAAVAGLPALADPGYDGAGIGILLPVRQPPCGREPDVNIRTRNASSGRCAAWVNAGSPCSPAAGAPSSTLLPAPAKSATSPARHSS